MEITNVTTKPEILTRKKAATKLPGKYLNTIDRAIISDEIDYCWMGSNKMVVVNKKWEDFLRRKIKDPHGFEGNEKSYSFK